MAKQKPRAPEIHYVQPPPIKCFSVSGDKLDRIEEACSGVSLDFTVALSACSVGLTTLVTYFSIPQLTPNQTVVFIAVIVICALIALYTGIRWLLSRNKVRSIIKAIRHSDQPENNV